MRCWGSNRSKIGSAYMEFCSKTTKDTAKSNVKGKILWYNTWSEEGLQLWTESKWHAKKGYTLFMYNSPCLINLSLSLWVFSLTSESLTSESHWQRKFACHLLSWIQKASPWNIYHLTKSYCDMGYPAAIQGNRQHVSTIRVLSFSKWETACWSCHNVLAGHSPNNRLQQSLTDCKAVRATAKC